VHPARGENLLLSVSAGVFSKLGPGSLRLRPALIGHLDVAQLRQNSAELIQGKRRSPSVARLAKKEGGAREMNAGLEKLSLQFTYLSQAQTDMRLRGLVAAFGRKLTAMVGTMDWKASLG
jgi:hypothetical protein